MQDGTDMEAPATEGLAKAGTVREQQHTDGEGNNTALSSAR